MKKKMALASQRRISSCRSIEDVPPSKAFRYELATRNWIDLFPDWEEGVGRLSERLASIVGAAPELDRGGEAPARPAPPQQPCSLRRRGACWRRRGSGGGIAVDGAVLWFTIRPPPVVPTRRSPPRPRPPPAKPVATPTRSPPSRRRRARSDRAPSPTRHAGATAIPPTPVAPLRRAGSPAPAGRHRADPPVPVAWSPRRFSRRPPRRRPRQFNPPPPRRSPRPLPSQSRTLHRPGAAIAANDPGGEVFKECEDCPEMVVIPAGKAMLGSRPAKPDGDDRRS